MNAASAQAMEPIFAKLREEMLRLSMRPSAVTHKHMCEVRPLHEKQEKEKRRGNVRAASVSAHAPVSSSSASSCLPIPMAA